MVTSIRLDADARTFLRVACRRLHSLAFSADQTFGYGLHVGQLDSNCYLSVGDS